MEQGPKKNSIEFEGATVEEAIDNAVKHYRVPRQDLEIKIVCEAKKGLFGMEGAKPAKIKVFLKK